MFLVLVAVIICLVVSRWRWPLRPCPRCGGKGTNRGSTGRRYGRCPRCKGTKQVRRAGAGAVHRFFWSVAGAAMKERAQKRVEKAQDKAKYPES